MPKPKPYLFSSASPTAQGRARYEANTTSTKTDPYERLGRNIKPQPNGCWLWQGSTSTGYGQTSYIPGQRTAVAHRVVYQTLVGDIPDGHVLHHECGNKACVNPAHLTPLTQSDHTRLHKRT